MSRLLVLLLLAAGCRSLVTTPEKDEADARWDDLRTRVALQTAGRKLQHGDLVGARRELQMAAAMGSADARIHLLLARIALEDGRYAECGMELAEVRALDPGDPSADFLEGMLAETQERWDDAARAYAAAGAKRPDDPAPVLAQVRALHGAGRPDAAWELLLRELERRPQSVELNVAAGEEQLAAERYDAALLHLEKALVFDPEHPGARAAKGLALHRAGRHEEALPVLQACVAGGDDPLLQLALAQSALIAGDYDAAVPAFRAYLAGSPNEPEVLYDLARALFLAGREPESLSALETLLALQPDFADAVVLKGHVRFRAGNWGEAVRTYREALRLGADPAVVQSLIEAAAAREARGG